MIRSILAGRLTAAALGCAAADEGRQAQDPAQARPGERSATLADMGLAPAAPLDLETGLRLALVHNPAVARARTRAEAAEARLDQASAGRWPQITASLSYS